MLTPAHQAILTTAGGTNIEARAYARDRIKQVQVYDGGTLVGTKVVDLLCTGNITNTQWTQAWVATEGSHSLTSRVTPCAGATASSRQLSTGGLAPAAAPGLSDRPQPAAAALLRPGGPRWAGLRSPAGTGVARVEVSVDGGAWDEASLQGTDWRYEWYLGQEPDNAEYNVAVRATDFAGWNTQTAHAVTVDLDVPNPITLTLTSDVTGGGVVRAGTTLRQIPATLNLAWQASEPVTKLLSYQALWTVETATQTLQIPAVVPPAGPLASAYPALFDAQRVSPRSPVSSWMAIRRWTIGGRSTWIRPSRRTSLLSPPLRAGAGWGVYRGWMDSGCSAIGLDRRIAEAMPTGAALNVPQNLYVTWDSEALRLAWTGANWDYNGDLFIYMDTLSDPTVPQVLSTCSHPPRASRSTSQAQGPSSGCTTRSTLSSAIGRTKAGIKQS